MDTNQSNKKDTATTECDGFKKFRIDGCGNRRTDKEAATIALSSAMERIAVVKITIEAIACGIKSKTASESAIHGMHSLVDEVFEDMYIALLVLDL